MLPHLQRGNGTAGRPKARINLENRYRSSPINELWSAGPWEKGTVVWDKTLPEAGLHNWLGNRHQNISSTAWGCVSFHPDFDFVPSCVLIFSSGFST